MKPRVAAALAATLSLACAPGLTGCQTGLALQPAASDQLRASQALYVAEAAFKGASASLEQATQQGLLKGAAASKARDLYDQAHAALLAARQAKADADYALELSGASDAITSSGQIQAAAAAAAPAKEPQT